MKTNVPYDKVENLIKERVLFETRRRPLMGCGTGCHVQSRDYGIVYVVYSYGPHYPMFLYDKECSRWFVNSDKSSKTTNRHKWRFAPTSQMEHLSTETLQAIINLGSYLNYLTEKLAR